MERLGTGGLRYSWSRTRTATTALTPYGSQNKNDRYIHPNITVSNNNPREKGTTFYVTPTVAR